MILPVIAGVLYKIREISTVKDSRLTYVLVDFWTGRANFERGKPPILINDFLMQLHTTSVRIVTRADGRLKLLDGTFVDPKAETTRDIPNDQFDRETVDHDLPDEMKANIEAYWKRAQARGDIGSKLDPRIHRDQSDPEGVLAKPEVRALVGADIEVMGP
ncbi:hypothetical protein LCGC14_0310760 [marine sediment metagenome]|uniref:Uncharacterized protein n=1 Tax=marine sediment metagenome TaxID=412755 RepID=A0A0F9WTW4_9ZZZZ